MKEAGPILPFSVRYALRYRGGRLQREEIGSMVTPEFVNESIYLISKALNDKLNRQQALLEEVVDRTLREEITTPAFLEYLKDQAKKLPADVSVESVKLAQFSRQGFDLWRKKYYELAEELRDSGTVPVLVAHASFQGLTQFLEVFRDSGISLMMLNPAWTEREIVGYEIDCARKHGERVRTLDPLFGRPENAVLVDETKRYGSNLRKVAQLWGVPIGERIIDRVPQDHRLTF